MKNFFLKNALLILFTIFLVGTLIVAMVPSYREYFQNLILTDKKIVLSTVSGRISKEGPSVVVTKVRYKSKLWAEVYKIDTSSGATQLWQTIPLSSHQDAFLGLNIKSTNLALLDIDHDDILEIVAPTFDEQMNPKLNIYKYNSKSELFISN
ncbi:MAG TPA: hypothetical protein PLJ21_13090 [Pseudobdellovibrionaceae bacterium]|nr:hypothetical protein [Pseudobdellovibrionaceae bacterium]